MKAYLVALASVALISVAAPASAAYVRETPRAQEYQSYQGQQQDPVYAPQASANAHCRDVLSGNGVWGQKEIDYCRDNSF